MWFFSIRNSKGVNSFPYLNRINLGDVAATHQTLIFPIFNLILKWLTIIYTNLMCLFVLQILLRVKSKFLILINLKTRSSQTKWHFIFFINTARNLLVILLFAVIIFRAVAGQTPFLNTLQSKRIKCSPFPYYRIEKSELTVR